MAKAQVKKAAGARKGDASRTVSRPKGAGAAKAKAAGKKPAPTAKKTAAPAKKAAAKPVRKPAAKVPPKPAKAVKPGKAAKPAKAAAKPVKAAPKGKPAAKKPAPKAPSKAAAVVRTVAKAVKKVVEKVKPAAAPKKPVAVAPVAPKAPVAPNVPAVAAAPGAEKKRTRRPRLRITSNGAPAAAWLSTEKPRPASFIPAPPRAEAPSAVAAPPASSDRLIRPEDVSNLAVRTVPVRVDIEQGAGRYYVIANPFEVSVKPGEGIEWDFRYIGGADVNVDEVIIEFEKPLPFQHGVFKTRKPGGARPHRQLSGGALPSAVGRRAEYVIRAMNAFKTEVARAKVAVTVTA